MEGFLDIDRGLIEPPYMNDTSSEGVKQIAIDDLNQTLLSNQSSMLLDSPQQVGLIDKQNNVLEIDTFHNPLSCEGDLNSHEAEMFLDTHSPIVVASPHGEVVVPTPRESPFSSNATPTVDIHMCLQQLILSMNAMRADMNTKLELNAEALKTDMKDIKAEINKLSIDLDEKLQNNKIEVLASVKQEIETNNKCWSAGLNNLEAALEQEKKNVRALIEDKVQNTKVELSDEIIVLKSDLEIKISEVRKDLNEQQVKIPQVENHIARHSIQILELQTASKQTEVSWTSFKEQIVIELSKVISNKTEDRLSPGVLHSENHFFSEQQDNLEVNDNFHNPQMSINSETFIPRCSNLDISQNRSFFTNFLKHDTKPTFDGSRPDIFMKNLETFIKLSRVSEEDIIENFQFFLKGKALQWWEITRQPGERWQTLKSRFMAYWFNRDRLKEVWKKLVCRPHYDIERFALKALQLQDTLKADSSVEKRIEKVAAKLPTPLREFILMRKSSSIEQFLENLKEIIKYQNYEGSESMKNNNYQEGNTRRRIFQPGIRDRVVLNSKFNSYRASPYRSLAPRRQERPSDSTHYEWDREGNAFNTEGICVWEKKVNHPPRGQKYVNAIGTPSSPISQPDLNI